MKHLTLGERLAKVEVKLEEVKKGFSNHLMHHWAVEIMLAAALVAWLFQNYF